MIQNDFSQLPVIDKNDDLLGIITNQSILRADYYSDGKIPLMNLPVKHCLEKPEVVGKRDEIFKVIQLLEHQYSVVVVEENKPLAIISFYDMNVFFRELSSGIILIEEIERYLRETIKSVLPDKDNFCKALRISIGSNRGVNPDAERELTDLSLGEIKDLICHQKNWENFKHLIPDKKIFNNYMKETIAIRNQIMHFRGKLEPIQMNCLQTVYQWLVKR